MSIDHDAHYKRLFSHSGMVRDLLRGFVKVPWVKEADFSTLERVESSYVSKRHRRRHSDLVWRLKVGKDWVWVYLLLEFQAKPDKWMAVRMMTYLGLLAEDLVKRKELSASGKLPPILPIVLYRGTPRWTASLDVADCFTAPPGGMGRFVPHLAHLLFDETRLKFNRDEAVRNFVAALFRMEQGHSLQDVEDVLRGLGKLCGQSPEHEKLMDDFVDWLGNSLLPDDAPASTIGNINALLEDRGMLHEKVQRWYKEARDEGMMAGIAQGIEQGIEQGLYRGREEERRAVVCRLLELGKPVEEIELITGLPREQIRSLMH